MSIDELYAEDVAPEGRLFGILCDDGGVIPCATADQRDHLWEHMRKQNGAAGCRIPEARLYRSSPDTEWQRRQEDNS